MYRNFQSCTKGIGALPGLEELCEMLCMGNEDNLSGFNFREAVPLLIKLLQDQEVQVSQAAARALTYLLDSLPRSSHAVAQARVSTIKIRLCQNLNRLLNGH